MGGPPTRRPLAFTASLCSVRRLPLTSTPLRSRWRGRRPWPSWPPLASSSPADDFSLLGRRADDCVRAAHPVALGHLMPVLTWSSPRSPHEPRQEPFVVRPPYFHDRPPAGCALTASLRSCGCGLAWVSRRRALSSEWWCHSSQSPLWLSAPSRPYIPKGRDHSRVKFPHDDVLAPPWPPSRCARAVATSRARDRSSHWPAAGPARARRRCSARHAVCLRASGGGTRLGGRNRHHRDTCPDGRDDGQ